MHVDEDKARKELVKLGIDHPESIGSWYAFRSGVFQGADLPEVWRVRLQATALGYWGRAGDGFPRLIRLEEGWFSVGPANAQPSLSEEWEALDWPLPAPMRRLYQICDGAGPLGHVRGWPWRHGLLPVDEVAPLTSRMRFGEENILYQPASWWAIARATNGNMWCCNTADGALAVRLWDAGTHRLGPVRSWETMLSELSRHW